MIILSVQDILRTHEIEYRCSHQTPDLSPEPVHRVFTSSLAAPMSCMHSASSETTHRSGQSFPCLMRNKLEPILHKAPHERNCQYRQWRGIDLAPPLPNMLPSEQDYQLPPASRSPPTSTRRRPGSRPQTLQVPPSSLA